MKRHTDWLKGQIQTVAPLAAKTFVTRAQYPAPNQAVVAVPYVVIHPVEGTDEVTRFSGPASTQNPRYTIHSVGLDYDQCAAVAEAVKGVLVVNGFGVVPNVPGELSGSLEYSSPTPIQMDDDVSPPLCYHVAEVGWSSDPA